MVSDQKICSASFLTIQLVELESKLTKRISVATLNFSKIVLSPAAYGGALNTKSRSVIEMLYCKY